MANLQGATLKSAVKKIIGMCLPAHKGEKVLTGKRGAPVRVTLAELAADYLSHLPANLVGAISENIDLIGGVFDALATAREELDDEQASALENGRDAEVMGTLDGEAVGPDTFNRYSVNRQEGESLGLALRRRAKYLATVAQNEANESGRTLFMFALRYAADRNLRDAKRAADAGMPAELVGRMSGNIASLVITSNGEKALKGVVALVGAYVPEPKAKRPRGAATVPQTVSAEAAPVAV